MHHIGDLVSIGRELCLDRWMNSYPLERWLSMMSLELTTPHSCHPGLVEYCIIIYSNQ